MKDLLELRNRRHRERAGLTRVEGYEELDLALRCGVKPKILVYCPLLLRHETERQFLDRFRELGADLYEVSEHVFRHVSYREGPDGWLAVVPKPGIELQDVKLPESPLVLVAEGIEKPGNLGAIFRTADAAGCDLIISASGVTDIGNPNVVRASKGTVFSVPVMETTDSEALTWLRDKGIAVISASPDATTTYTQADMRGAVAIVVGAEHGGLSQLWRDEARELVRIPMHGVVNSLNVSVSCALLAYEALRQRSHTERR